MKEEKDAGILVLRIDGPRLCHALNKMNLLPSSSPGSYIAVS